MASKVPKPISVSTSQAWDNDGAGQWSTFAVQVGTPAQTSRVIVSTAGDATWVVVDQGCPTEYGSNCAFNRGGIFGVGNSTSWTDISLYELDLELNLGYSGNGQYGHDTVTLGYPNSGGPRLSNQVVAGLATPDFWLGAFGLDPAPNNFTTLNDPQPSFLWSLVNKSMIPSTSWGYTAGAAYRYNKVQGSLTLGGYDASRFSSKNVTFSMYQDVARRFIADVRSITYIPTGVSTSTSTTTLSSSSIQMYIDSTIPYIYLPTAVCENFATDFGLQFNSTSELYTINSTMHTSLLGMNPNITFTLANTGGETLAIVLPYAAFDLTASFPVLANGTNSTTYFPIRRADNDTQYTLGRVFLQEAYLTADYDRSQFTISPCVWPSTFTQDIHAIYQPNSTLTGVKNKNKSSTPVGPIVGGAIGGIALLVIAFLLFWFCYWKPRRRKATELLANEVEKADLNPKTTPHPTQSELDPATASYAELSAYEEAEKKRRAQAEIGGTPILGHEMDSLTPIGSEVGANEIYEMPAREPVGSEMPSPLPSPLASPRARKTSPMLSVSSPRSPLSRGISVLGDGDGRQAAQGAGYR